MQIEVAGTDTAFTRIAAIRAELALPGEPAPDAEFMQCQNGFEFYLARIMEEPAGWAMCGSWVGDLSQGAFVDVGVLPRFRRRGFAAALLDRASVRAHELGADALLIEVREGDAEPLRFLQERAFVEVGREQAVALDLRSAVHSPPFVPPGIEILSRTEAHAEGMYGVATEAGEDIPGVAGGVGSFKAWRAFEIDRPSRDPRLAFVALADGAVVGYASIDRIGDTGYHGLTAVRRSYRRRGIARALKLHQVAGARELGLRTLVTESEERNEPMRRLNESLGYRSIPGSIVLQGPLLPGA